MKGDDLDLRGLPEPPAAAYATVRQRVLGRIRRRRRVRRAVSAIAAVAACIVLALWRPVEPAAVRPPMLAQAPQVPVLTAPVRGARFSVPVRASARAPRVWAKAHTSTLKRAPHNEPLLVRLETSDPNVVILWEVD